jgi:hypothetical protein
MYRQKVCHGSWVASLLGRLQALFAGRAGFAQLSARYVYVGQKPQTDRKVVPVLSLPLTVVRHSGNADGAGDTPARLVFRTWVGAAC